MGVQFPAFDINIISNITDTHDDAQQKGDEAYAEVFQLGVCSVALYWNIMLQLMTFWILLQSWSWLSYELFLSAI